MAEPKTYVCTHCGKEVKVSGQGKGEKAGSAPTCCGDPMQEKKK